CPSRVQRSFPATMSHRITVLPYWRFAGSTTPLAASVLPSPDSTAQRLPPSPVRVRSSLPEVTSQHLTVLSRLPDTSVLPAGEIASAETLSVCPLRVWSSFPEATSHILIVWSRLPVASTLLSGEKATQLTARRCPVRVRSSLPVAASQSRTFSQPPEANVLPSGVIARQRTSSRASREARSFGSWAEPRDAARQSPVRMTVSRCVFITASPCCVTMRWLTGSPSARPSVVSAQDQPLRLTLQQTQGEAAVPVKTVVPGLLPRPLDRLVQPF